MRRYKGASERQAVPLVIIASSPRIDCTRTHSYSHVSVLVALETMVLACFCFDGFCLFVFDM